MRSNAASPLPGAIQRAPLPLSPPRRLQLEFSKISARSVEENLGLLSNDEVLAVLKDREADKQPVISRATPSEIQVGSSLYRRRC